jgi:hypothetical protein
LLGLAKISKSMADVALAYWQIEGWTANLVGDPIDTHVVPGLSVPTVGNIFKVNIIQGQTAWAFSWTYRRVPFRGPSGVTGGDGSVRRNSLSNLVLFRELSSQGHSISPTWTDFLRTTENVSAAWSPAMVLNAICQSRHAMYNGGRNWK